MEFTPEEMIALKAIAGDRIRQDELKAISQAICGVGFELRDKAHRAGKADLHWKAGDEFMQQIVQFGVRLSIAPVQPGASPIWPHGDDVDFTFCGLPGRISREISGMSANLCTGSELFGSTGDISRFIKKAA